ncbi:MAG TPA: MaoC/PaaZ C-terminal domain-containing protein [Rhodocyclaceae bacterium]|nr:MaoC/PaaZ C-terminal domain-containing protein [Rhodocyclaceae bacterium]HMV22642.1 MaoC/PaaZ C-terminal domain-containing protein [Rhodocyclaceae bacterium]
MSSRTLKDPQDKTFDDFALGDVMVTRGRTVDVGDITLFSGLTGDHYPLHTDEEFGKASRFGTRIAHGPLTFSIAVGLVGMSGFYGNAIVALLEIRSLKASKPVVSGDTLRVHAEVVSLEPGSNPKYGTLHVNYSVRNQREEEVMNFLQIMLARRAAPEGGQRG